MVILHIQIQKVFNLVAGQKQFSFFSSFVFFFAKPLLLLLEPLLFDTILCMYVCMYVCMCVCISGLNSRTILASSTTMGNGERKRKTTSYIIMYIKRIKRKKVQQNSNVHCTHISTCTSPTVSKEQNGHPF